MSWFKRENNEIEATAEKRVRTEGLWVKCDDCRQVIWKKDLDANWNVCTKCERHFRIAHARPLRNEQRAGPGFAAQRHNVLAGFHRAPRALLSLRDADSGFLQVRASVGFDQDALQRVAQVAPDGRSGACGATFFTGERTRCRMISRSWIIRSRTTPISTLRKG